MKAEIIYVELKSGFSDNGPAWIGKGFYTSTRKTVYFNGQVFKRGKGIAGNHFDQESGDEYWISGVKKDRTDRHWAGGGKITLDRQSVSEYLAIINKEELPKNKFDIELLIQIPNKVLAVEIENEKAEPSFDNSIRFKELTDLTDKELEELMDYYEQLDLPEFYKKTRKNFIEAINNLEKEIQKRQAMKMAAIRKAAL